MKKQDYEKRRPWTLAEEELLKRYYSMPFKMDVDRIAYRLKRSEKSVQKKITHMKLTRLGRRNVGLREYLQNGGTLELPEEVVGLTNITERDREDAAKLEAALRKEWGDEA
jgi:hypothetical protein